MSPERWRQVEDLYHEVLEGAPGERALLLEQADPELRREVESLLAQPSGNGALEPSKLDICWVRTVSKPKLAQVE